MANEQATVEPSIDVHEPREFGSSLEDIFAKAMPGGLTIDEEESQPEKKGGGKDTPPEQTPSKKDEPKKSAKGTPTESPVSIADILQSKDGGGDKKVGEPAIDEPKKIEAPAELKGKSREHFEKLAQEKWEADKRAHALDKKTKELEKKLAEASADPRIPQLEAQVKDFSTRLERVGLEQHPWFEANFTAPRNQLVDSAKRALKDAGGDPEAITKALRLDGPARTERLDEIFGEITSTSARGRVERAIDAIDTLDGRRDQILQNRDAVLRGLREQDQINQKKMLDDYTKETRTGLNEAKELLRDKYGFFVFKTVDDPQYEWWNQEVKKMDNEAENLMLNTTDKRELRLGAYMAVAAPRIMQMLVKEVAARKAIEKEFSEYKGGEPKLGSGSRKSRVQETQEDEEDKPLVQAILDNIAKNS